MGLTRCDKMSFFTFINNNNRAKIHTLANVLTALMLELTYNHGAIGSSL